MPYLDVNGTQLYYEEHGSGNETILFGHSMLFNLRMFDDQVEFLKSKYRCILFDFRGQGKSKVAESGYDLDSLTEDITQLILALKCQLCHFVGFSMGGMVAQRIALKNPELLKSLILIDTSSEPQDQMFRNRILLWVAQNFGIKFLASKIMSMFFSAGFMQDKQREHLREKWKNHFLANDQVGVAKVVQGVIFRKGITEQLNQIHLPTVIMVGKNDTLTDYAKSKMMHDAIENSELRVIPRASHMSPVEEPDIVNQIIEEFLRKHSSSNDINV